MQQSEGAFVDQVIRPTGLLDPILEVRPTLNQIDDLLQEIHKRIALQERTLVTTLTKRMAEELAKYLDQAGIKCQYIHSEVDTLERVEILQRLRDGILDVLIGVNLLREGLDLPEVSLVVILDADKEGFLRNTRSLIQTIGRAARHVHGMAILYADRTTDSMQRAIDETDRRRKKQAAYNAERGLVPQPIIKPAQLLITQNQQNKADARRATSQKQDLYIDPVLDALQGKDLEKAIAELKKAMKKAAEEHEFMRAATLRDEIARLEKRLG
jgi:excinuclease ABC subunit B